MLLIINEISQDIANPFILNKITYTPLKIFHRRNNFIPDMQEIPTQQRHIYAIMLCIF